MFGTAVIYFVESRQGYRCSNARETPRMSTGLRDDPWNLIRLRPAEGERSPPALASRIIKELEHHVQSYFHIDDPHF